MIELFMMGDALRHPVIAGAFAVAALGGIAVATVNYGSDHILNHDRFVQLKEQFAQASVRACGEDKFPSKRNERIYADVHHDLDGYKTVFSWMPNGSAANLIETAIEKNVVLYPASLLERMYSFDKNVKGVLYNEGERGSVFVYGDLNRAQFGEIFNQIGQQSDQNGAFVVRYDDLHDQYQFVHVPEGQNTVMLPNGIEHVEIASDPCLSDGGLKGLAKQVVKDEAKKFWHRARDLFRHEP